MLYTWIQESNDPEQNTKYVEGYHPPPKLGWGDFIVIFARLWVVMLLKWGQYHTFHWGIFDQATNYVDDIFFHNFVVEVRIHGMDSVNEVKIDASGARDDIDPEQTPCLIALSLASIIEPWGWIFRKLAAHNFPPETKSSKTHCVVHGRIIEGNINHQREVRWIM